MAEKNIMKGYVKTENMLLIVFMTLVIGFVGGVVFGVYKTGSSLPGQTNDPSQPIPLAQNATPDRRTEIEALVKATTADPKNVETWVQLGHAYFDAGEAKKAIAAYETSLKLRPDDPDVITDLGVMYRRNGESQKAVEMFDKAIAINPRHEISRFNKGIVLMHDLNDPTGAVAAWEELLAINPKASAPNGTSVKEMVSHFKTQKTE
jgi:cytochrome c-type biogenesis protein CcmH/NrfG